MIFKGYNFRVSELPRPKGRGFSLLEDKKQIYLLKDGRCYQASCK